MIQRFSLTISVNLVTFGLFNYYTRKLYTLRTQNVRRNCGFEVKVIISLRQCLVEIHLPNKSFHLMAIFFRL